MRLVTSCFWAGDNAMSLVKACDKNGIQVAWQASGEMALSREEQTV